MDTETKELIKELALESGFKLKEQPDGSLDLNPYVYDFADKLILTCMQHFSDAQEAAVISEFLEK